MVCVPKAALIPDGDLTWVGGLAGAGSNVWKKEVLVDMRHGRTWSNGEYREHFGVNAEEARGSARPRVARPTHVHGRATLGALHARRETLIITQRCPGGQGLPGQLR